MPVGRNGEMEMEYQGLKNLKGLQHQKDKIEKDAVLLRSFRHWFEEQQRAIKFFRKVLDKCM